MKKLLLALITAITICATPAAPPGSSINVYGGTAVIQEDTFRNVRIHIYPRYRSDGKIEKDDIIITDALENMYIYRKTIKKPVNEEIEGRFILDKEHYLIDKTIVIKEKRAK